MFFIIGLIFFVFKGVSIMSNNQKLLLIDWDDTFCRNGVRHPILGKLINILPKHNIRCCIATNRSQAYILQELNTYVSQEAVDYLELTNYVDDKLSNFKITMEKLIDFLKGKILESTDGLPIFINDTDLLQSNSHSGVDNYNAFIRELIRQLEAEVQTGKAYYQGPGISDELFQTLSSICKNSIKAQYYESGQGRAQSADKENPGKIKQRMNAIRHFDLNSSTVKTCLIDDSFITCEELEACEELEESNNNFSSHFDGWDRDGNGIFSKHDKILSSIKKALESVGLDNESTRDIIRDLTPDIEVSSKSSCCSWLRLCCFCGVDRSSSRSMQDPLLLNVNLS